MKYFFEAGMGSIPVFLCQELPDAAGSVLWGLGAPTSSAFVSRKHCLQKSGSKLTLAADKSIILTGLLCKNLVN